MGKIKSIYCYQSADLWLTGGTLFQHYRESGKVESLMELGYIIYLASTLRSTVTSNGGFSADITNEYNFDLLTADKMSYLFVNGEWYYRDVGQGLFFPVPSP